jgi:hypothetical protein
MIFRIFLALAGALALAACNPGAQVEDADGLIRQFQADYNRGDAGALYDSVGETWRKVSPPEQMDGLVALISARLGQIKSSERVGFNTGFHNGITTTEIVMKSVFDKGEAEEIFLFHGADADMELVGWRVNSPLLALSPEDVDKLTKDASGRAR